MEFNIFVLDIVMHTCVKAPNAFTICLFCMNENKGIIIFCDVFIQASCGTKYLNCLEFFLYCKFVGRFILMLGYGSYFKEDLVIVAIEDGTADGLFGHYRKIRIIEAI